MKFIRFLFALLVSFSSLTVYGQTLRIQVLSGRNGKPVAHEHVNLFRTSEPFSDITGRRFTPGWTTDANGFISVSDIASDVHSVHISVDWHRPCSKVVPDFLLDEVMFKGLVSENACKPRIHAAAVPGTLIFFVRDETFFEKMAH
jgi:hypothetical protein